MAMNIREISQYRASLPCKVVELSDEEIRENQRRAKAEALWKARRDAGYQDPRDEELFRRIRQGYAERNRQAQERHTTDVREGYGDAVPDFEEME
jgi:hypothetical protein